MPGKEQTAKRGRTDLDDVTEGSTNEDIISLLKSLNSKMDVLSTNVTDNSNAIKDIDARLTEKIGKLESSVATSINGIKADVDARISSITTDVNKRIDQLATTTEALELKNEQAKQNYSTTLDMIQQEYELRSNKLEKELLRNELIVTGVPATYGERVLDIIADICGALQCT